MKIFFRASVPVMLAYALIVIQVGAQESPAKDMMTFPRPIEALDNVWIEEQACGCGSLRIFVGATRRPVVGCSMPHDSSVERL